MNLLRSIRTLSISRVAYVKREGVVGQAFWSGPLKQGGSVDVAGLGRVLIDNVSLSYELEITQK